MRTLTVVLLAVLLLAAPLLAQTERQQESIKRADSLVRDGLCDRAIELLLALERDLPDNADVKLTLQRAYVCAKRFEDALAVLEGLIDAEPNPFRRLDYLVEVSQVHLRQGAKDPAEEKLQEAIAIEPRNPETFRKAAQAYMVNGYYSDAVRVYEQGRNKLAAKDLFARDLGHLHEIMRNYGAAVTEYFRLLMQDSTQTNYVNARVGDLIARDAQEEYDTGLAGALAGLVRLHPENFHTHKFYGDYLIGQGQFEAAFNRYRLVDSLAEGDGQEMLYFCKVAGDRDDYQTAELARNYLMTTHADSPVITAAGFIVAETYFNNGLFESAIGVYEELDTRGKIPRDHADALFYLGFTKFRGLRDPQGALEVFDRLASRYPRSGSTHIAALFYADCHLALGQPVVAESLYLAIELKSLPTRYQEELLFRRGELYFYLGDFETARQAYAELMKAFPKSVFVNDCLRRIMLITEYADLDQPTLRLFSEALYADVRFDYDSALVTYDVLKQRGGGTLAQLAWFHSGRTYELLDRPAEALTEFDSLITRHPESFYAPLAIEEKGDVLWRQLAEPALARDMYEKVLLEFPQSLNLETVRKKLRSVQELLDRAESAPKS